MAAAGPTTSIETLKDLVRRYGELVCAVESKAAGDSTIRELLSVRDRIATCVQYTDNLPTEIADQICAIDERMKGCSRYLTLRAPPTVESLREVTRPPAESWWWYQGSPWTAAWAIGAAILLTLAASLIADFARRMLGSDPDELGIGAIALQAVLVVGAGSTFTGAGRRWMEAQLRRAGVLASVRNNWTFFASLLLVLIVYAGWAYLPRRMAEHYDKRARQQCKPEKPELPCDFAAAVRNYQRAISLYSSVEQAHHNLGQLYDTHQYAYEGAAAEYRKAIAINPSYLEAYSDLGRALILQGQPLSALRILDDGVARSKQHAPRPDTALAVYKNRAWAEYLLGFDDTAEQDAKAALNIAAKMAAQGAPELAPNTAPVQCILGKVYSRMKRQAEAQAAWRRVRELGIGKEGMPAADADCLRLAQEATHEIH